LKITIFPKANYLPKSKEDKIALSKKVSNPNLPEVVEINTEEDLIQIVTSTGWSPCVFSGFRHNDNFVSTDFMSLDIDSGLSIESAENRVQSLGLACLCLPSPSHSPELHRFRLIFPLAKTIYNSEDFEATWDWLQGQFPELDKQCSDLARWYAPSRMDDGFWQEGDFLVPKKAPEKVKKQHFSETLVEVPEDLKDIVKLLYGKDREAIPEAVEFFLTNAHTGLPGLWINSLNSFVFSLALSGVDDTIIQEVVEKVAPEALDKKDEYQIKRSIRDGKRAREEL
jgi:hypothetical protein